MPSKTTRKTPKPNTRKSTQRSDDQAKPNSAGWHRLAEAIATTRLLSKRGSLSHAECEDGLAFYVDAESRGEAAQTLYPRIWKHLLSCERCRMYHTRLTETLHETASQDTPFPSSPPELSLPFLTRRSQSASWSTQVHSRIASAPLHFTITVRALFLWNHLAPPGASLVTRSEPSSASSLLLLSDTFSLGSDEVDVEVRTARPEDAEHVQLQVLLASSVPLTESLKVTLLWNNHKLSAPVHHDRATFDGIPLSDLKTISDLRLEFQAGSEVAGIEPHESTS